MARWWRRGDADPALPPAQSATGNTPSAAPPPVQRAAWQDLPPLRPTLTATPPIAPRDSFTASLATSHNPSFLAPLGHIVDPDGPSGHVEGLASPVAPQVISGGPDLPVAQRQASAAATVVQRVLTPRMWLSDSTGGDRPGTPRSVQSEPTFSIPDEQPPAAAEDHPRRLESVSPAVSQRAFTTAPDQDVVRALPVVAAPSQASPGPVPAPSVASMPTVSRQIAENHGDGNPGDETVPDSAGPDGPAPESTGQMAPLLGDTGQALGDHPTPGVDAGSASAGGSPGGDGLAAPVQRTAADAPVRRPGLGAPLPSVPDFHSETPSKSPTMPAVQRIAGSAGPDVRHGLPSPAAPQVQRSAAPDVPDSPDGHHPADAADGAQPGTPTGSVPDAPVLGLSTVMRAPDPATPADPTASSNAAQSTGSAGHQVVAARSVQRSSRPLGLGAPLASAGVASVQRQVEAAAPGSGPSLTTPPGTQPYPNDSSAPSVIQSPTVGLTDPVTAPSSIPLGSTMGEGQSAAASGAADVDLVLPAPVQRTMDAARPAGAPVAADADGSPAATDVAPLTSQFQGEVAPLLGAADSTNSGPSASTSATSQQVSATPPNAVGFGPLVQRAATAAPGQRSSASTTGLGAPLPSVPATATTSERLVTAREMSLQRMFEPGAAAIASGAAYSDGANSVVFRSPTTNPPVIDSAPSTTMSHPATSNPAMSNTAPTNEPMSHSPMSNLPVAKSALAQLPVAPAPLTNPTLGSSFGGDPAVQRFGLPSASSLLSGARKAASGVADTARQTAGSYADTARQTAGSYADTARQTAGNYANTARDTAGGYLNQARGAADTAVSGAAGYLDSARNAAGGYADSAAGAASGYLASARNAAGGVADRAGAAVDDAASAAQGAVGGAVDSVSNAASGAQAAAGDAVSGAAGAVAGAAGAVGGAVAGAAGALPTDLDELARRLFDPLSARFKSELWLDRERAGMVTDLRR